MSDYAVEVQNLTKIFRLYSERNDSLKSAVLSGRRSKYEEFFALENISLQIPRGSTFGLIGSNGSGKTSLLKCIARILIPDQGTITTRGSIASLLELGSGFHPELTGRENIYLNGSIMRLDRDEIDRKIDSIVEFAGVGDFIDQPVKSYSSGMYVRLGFSVATHIDPDILLVDEVISVGDAAFQAKCREVFTDFRRRGKTVIVASHALGAVETMCDEVARLDQGELVEVYQTARRLGTTGIVVSPEDGPMFAGADHGLGLPSNPEDRRAMGARSGNPALPQLHLLDAYGFTNSIVRSGDAVTLALDYDLPTALNRPVVAFELRSSDGVLIWAQHSRDAALIPDTLQGRGRIELQLPRLPLQAGAYEIRAALLDDWLREVFHSASFGRCLEVTHSSVTETQGLVVLGGLWSARTLHH